MNEVVYTIGHSTHPIDEFISMLIAFKIEKVVDVRTIPKSRHNPQFNEEELREQLLKHAIEYVRLEGLGGLRHTTKTSINTAWKNASFRGYADYMQTPEFARALEELIDLAKKKTGCHHVRGSSTLAMSPVADRRCFVDSKYKSGRHI